MRDVTFRLCAAVCLIALSLGGSAHAAQFIFRGAVLAGRDDAGIFGPFGRDLTGRPYSLEIDFDASKGAPVSGAPLAFSQGGSDLDSPLTVALTVAGQRRQLFDFGITTSYFAASEPLNAVNFAPGGSDYVFSYRSYNLDGYQNTLGFGRAANLSDGLFYASFGDPQSTGLLLGPGQYVAPGSVPEPAGWVLAIIGFGMIGSASRASRRPSSQSLTLRGADRVPSRKSTQFEETRPRLLH